MLYDSHVQKGLRHTVSIRGVLKLRPGQGWWEGESQTFDPESLAARYVVTCRHSGYLRAISASVYVSWVVSIPVQRPVFQIDSKLGGL